MAKWKASLIICFSYAFLIWPLGNNLAHAADIWVKGSDIYLKGQIKWEDYDRLKRIISGYSRTNRVVIVNSPGGSLYGGIYMGRLIRENGLETHLIGDCSSACNHIFAGGFFRSMKHDARLGLHIGGQRYDSTFYTTDEMYTVQQKAAEVMIDRVYHYLSMGISVDVLALMATKDINGIRWMYKSEAKKLNFVNK